MSAQDRPDFRETNDHSASADRNPQSITGRPVTCLLPPWKVILHNDDVNSLEKVVEAVHQLTPLNRAESFSRTLEAHNSGVCLLLVTHRERAELYIEQFLSRRMTVTIEPA